MHCLTQSTKWFCRGILIAHLGQARGYTMRIFVIWREAARPYGRANIPVKGWTTAASRTAFPCAASPLQKQPTGNQANPARIGPRRADSGPPGWWHAMRIRRAPEVGSQWTGRVAAR